MSAYATSAQIAEMYERQALAQTKGGKKGKGGDANAKASGSKPAGAKKGKGKKKE